MTDSLITKLNTVNSEPSDEEGLAIGQWYWVKVTDEDSERRITRCEKGEEIGSWLGCVTHIGSNYAEIRSIESDHGYSHIRVHFDNFIDICTPEPEAEKIIAAQVLKYQQKAQLLIGKVQELTRSLAIAPRQELDSGEETQALALISGSQRPVGEYKQALILAKDETLPKLFEKIKKANEAMGAWMKAPLIKMKAELEILKPAIKLIEARVFNVELYAGLVEQVEQIKDGEPAAISEPVHIFQRRAYMDEECLAQYETGGMEFKDIEAFDKWLINPQNLRRLLPFPRCILAFQVRRKDKVRESVNLSDFIRIMFQEREDKRTFLYLRNGQQVFRLNTEIEFDEQLFPDVERSKLDGVVYARMWGNDRVEDLISENEYLDMVRKDREAKKKAERDRKEAKRKGEPTWHSFGYYGGRISEYKKWTPDNVHYDDISTYIKDQIEKHNRLVLVLQGLFDRSPVFHPHPPYQLWTGEGFNQAIKLIYDDSRALTVGDKPDLEAYRAYLNSSLKPGDITVGQEVYWEIQEAEKECKRLDATAWRHKSEWRPKRYRPEGNLGPGRLAVVHSVTKKGCVYKWEKERAYRRYGYDPDALIPCSITVPFSDILNVSGYMMGEFQRFYKDPRCRADYLGWAPLLLVAEEYADGKLDDTGRRKKQR